jgi:hypothetical protein
MLNDDVRSWLGKTFDHDYGTDSYVMPHNAAGAWLVEPKALASMWSDTCLMNLRRLTMETFSTLDFAADIMRDGVKKPIIIDGTETDRVKKFEIVDGYHRIIAAGTVGVKVPVCLIDMSAKGKKPSKRLIKDFLEAVYSKKVKVTE